jgi:methylmalonyl-CoA mutase N-terminal domain/subunit
MLPAIETGWIQSQIQDSAYTYQRSIESGERVVVGVNRFETQEKEHISIHANDPELEKDQVMRLNALRRTRDPQALAESLRRVESACRSEENLFPHIFQAVAAYASVGEISDVFRKVHGEYREAPLA